MNRFSICCLVALAMLCGCNSFVPTNTMGFIDLDANTVKVEYGEIPHKQTQADGRELAFSGAVRLTLADGKQVMLYQDMSPIGVLYHSRGKDYIMFERGPYCVISHNGEKIFEGLYTESQKTEVPAGRRTVRE